MLGACPHFGCNADSVGDGKVLFRRLLVSGACRRRVLCASTQSERHHAAKTKRALLESGGEGLIVSLRRA